MTIAGNDPRPPRSRLPIFALIAWALVALAIPRSVQALNAVQVAGFRVGFLMMALGCFVALILIAVVSARRQARLDQAATGIE